MNYISKSLKNDRRPILAKRQSNQVRVTIGNKSKDILIQERSLIFDRFHRSDLAHIHQIEELGREIAYPYGGNLTIDEISTGQPFFTLILSIVKIHGISTKNHSC